MQAGDLLHCASGRAFCLQQVLNPLALRKQKNLFLYESGISSCILQAGKPLALCKREASCIVQAGEPCAYSKR